MTDLDDFVQMVATVAAGDPRIIEGLQAGTLDIAEELPRLFELAAEAMARNFARYQNDRVYRAALNLAIYEQVIHEAGMANLRALSEDIGPNDGPPHSLQWYRGEA